MGLNVSTGAGAWPPVIGLWRSNGAGVWSPVSGVWRSNGSGWDQVWPTATHFHEVVPSGGNIQAAMDRARDWFAANKGIPVNFDDEQTMACVELVAGGVYNLGSTPLYYRRGVRLVGAGSGATRPRIVGTSTSHILRTSSTGLSGYGNPDTDWMVHNLRLDCNLYSGGISTAHTQRFRVSNCQLYDLGGVKHFIEINSSGKAPAATGTYHCQVIGCEFFSSTSPPINGEARRTLDECVQLDYSWIGAAPGTGGDGTVTNNVLIEDCSFHHVPRAIGGHRFQAEAGNASPKGIPTNVMIRGNTFTSVSPETYGSGANSVNSEGAVRAYMWENVHILDNLFDFCFQPVNLYIPSDAVATFGSPTYFRIANNTIRNKTSSRYGIFGTSAHASLRLSQVLIESNTADGSWTSAPDIYLAGCDDTTGTVPGFSNGVVIRNNLFTPSNMTVAEEAAYNKYRAANASNATGVLITGNRISDGSIDNS